MAGLLSVANHNPLNNMIKVVYLVTGTALFVGSSYIQIAAIFLHLKQ